MGRGGEGEEGDVAVEVADGFGLGEIEGDGLVAGDGAFGPDDFLHGLGGSDPGAAGFGPAVAAFHGDLEVESVGFGEGVVDEVAPLGAHEFDGAVDGALVDGEVLRAGEADVFHGFEVSGDSFRGDVAADPVPPGAGLGGVGWIEEVVVEGGGARGAREEDERGKREEEGADGFHLQLRGRSGEGTIRE